MSGKPKGQVSIETLFTVTVVLAILVIVTATAISESNQVRSIETYLYQEDKCTEISGILDALALHHGNANATIDVTGYEVWVTSNGTIIVKKAGFEGNPSFCSTIAPEIRNQTSGTMFHAERGSRIVLATKSWDTIILRVV